MGKIGPLLLYISLHIEGHVVHNYLINFGVSTTIIPNKIVDVMHFKCMRTSNEVLQLDGNNVRPIGIIKGVGMRLQKCSKISIIQDIIVVDLPPLFNSTYLESSLVNLEATCPWITHISWFYVRKIE